MPPSKAPEGTVGVQRLLALAVLCSDCHSMFHLGRARIIGTFPTVKQRLMYFNGWAEPDYMQYTNQQHKLGVARAKWHWALDISLVRKAGPLTIKTGSGAWSYHDDEGFLTAPAKYTDEECFTVILGASYIVESRMIDAADTTKARDGLLQEEGDFAFAQWIRQRRVCS